MKDFEKKIDGLDLSLFDTVHSQTSPNDKRSLLAIQKGVRELTGGFTYLEIGSYHGGTLQPYVVDPLCTRVFSIDLRPVESADERGVSQIYTNNTTAFMRGNLEKIAGADLDKLTTIDSDVKDIGTDAIDTKPQLLFIDGEHTDPATMRDYKFCRSVMADSGAIIFHDAMIVYNCLREITQQLEESGTKFRAYNLPDVVFVIELGDFPLHSTPAISELLANNHVGYLNSLHFTDQYRAFANKPLFRTMRALKAKLTGSNVTK